MSRRIGSPSRAGLDWRVVGIVAAIAAALLIVVAAVIFGQPDPRWTGQIQPDEGRQHVAVGTSVNYRSVPPTSGNHYSSANPQCPMNWGVYTSPVLKECVVHNLEHGGIIIWYQSTLPQAQVQQLADFVNAQLSTSQFKYILTPWDGQDFHHPIAVTAWRYLLYLDTANLDAIKSFASQHYQKSPEPNGGPAAPV
jgi:hypothetical protein